jgi:hypothetical protein
MAVFVALYSGASVAEAKLIAVSVDPGLVAEVSAKLLKETECDEPDPVIARLERGRRSALRFISREARK